MSRFKVGMRVHFVDDNKVRKGVIYMTFDNSDSLVIESDDGKYKRRFDEIVIIEEKPEEPIESEEPKKELKEEITITRDKFKEIFTKAITPNELTKNIDKDMSPTMLFVILLTGLVIERSVERLLFEND